MSLVTLNIDTPSIATIALSDELNLNAMSEEMANQFRQVVSTLIQHGSLRAVILTGAGKAFSAGGHLEMLEKKRTIEPEENYRLMLDFYDSFLSLLTLQVPLIAAINGAAVGAGLCVACACDIRIASESAKLGFTFLKLGLHPGMGGTFLLPRIVGRAVATELLLTARIIDAQESLRLGLISQVVAHDKLVERAQAIAQEILKCGPLATKQLLQTMRADFNELKKALMNEARCQSINYAGAEYAEGLASVRERRVAKFQ